MLRMVREFRRPTCTVLQLRERGWVARLGHAEGQIPALMAQLRMLPRWQRLHAVIDQSAGPAPDQHIAMTERQVARALLTREPTPEKGAGQA